MAVPCSANSKCFSPSSSPSPAVSSGSIFPAPLSHHRALRLLRKHPFNHHLPSRSPPPPPPLFPASTAFLRRAPSIPPPLPITTHFGQNPILSQQSTPLPLLRARIHCHGHYLPPLRSNQQHPNTQTIQSATVLVLTASNSTRIISMPHPLFQPPHDPAPPFSTAGHLPSILFICSKPKPKAKRERTQEERRHSEEEEPNTSLQQSSLWLFSSLLGGADGFELVVKTN